ncbi:uncharacterized protein LOC131994134 [Stomoxys calcitrans]|uniref:Uncharacterized protein n=1 Tax=Stomoxys calcitrans TaxID=35570 RepID=A0A1I8PYA5_STOCA|nr:uncharacterized protein LOC131994134 [Stomoxys calcitrans]
MRSILGSITVFQIIAWFGALSDADTEFACAIREGIFIDVFTLKHGVENLQADVDDMYKNTKTQIKILEELQQQQNHVIYNTCDKVTTQITETFKQYNGMEGHLDHTLKEIQDEQSAIFDKIVQLQDQAEHCFQTYVHDVMAKTFEGVKNKVDKFEEQLVNFELMKESVHKQRQAKWQILMSGENFKMVQSINERLSQNLQKIKDYENFLLSFQNITDFVNSLATKRNSKYDILLKTAKLQMKNW